jgi:hypothetical protein
MDSNRRDLVKGLGILFWGFIPFLHACDWLSAKTQSKEEKIRISPGAQTPPVPRKSIPPIDTAVPGRIETATFALG